MAQKQNYDSDDTKKRLAQAASLAKKGQYQKARFVLKDLHQHPRAAKILRQIEGRDDKKDGAGLAFSGTILAMLGFGVLIIVVIIFGLNTIESEQDQRGALLEEAESLGFDDGTLYINLIDFCRDETDAGETCNTWAQTVYADNQALLRNCLSIDDSSFIINENNREGILVCLGEQGIPLPAAS